MARTGGERGWWLIAALLCAAVGRTAAGCDGGGGGPGGTDPEVVDALQALLDDTGPLLVDPALARAEVSARALADAVRVWESGGDDDRAAAQAAWRAAMADWQGAELVQVGPLGSSLTAVGGRDLRDRVYSWPTTNQCAVDQETVAEEWGSPRFFDENLVTVMGLGALEVLLFSPPGVNACPSQVDINSSGAWAALGEEGVQTLRASYAVALADGVVATLTEARGQWDDFDDQFAAAGDQDPYESQDAAVNAVFDALFYLETRTKDRKLGEPLGLRDCGADSCLHVVETPIAGGSNEWIAANLRAGRAVFQGGEGAGLEELLRSLDHDDLADRVLAAFDDADAAALALVIPVDVAATTDPSDAVALHGAVDRVCELLRGDLATTLRLQIPTEAAGDND